MLKIIGAHHVQRRNDDMFCRAAYKWRKESWFIFPEGYKPDFAKELISFLLNLDCSDKLLEKLQEVYGQ